MYFKDADMAGAGFNNWLIGSGLNSALDILELDFVS